MQQLGRTLLVALVAAILSGCAVQPGVSPAPAVATSPAFSSDEAAFAAAEATYRAYVDALNQVDLADPRTFEPVYKWTTGEANAGARKYLTNLHADSIELRGNSTVQSIWFLRSHSEAIEMAVCLDVSGVTLVDQYGSSVVDPARPDLQSFRIELAKSLRLPFGLAVAHFASGGPAQCGP